MHWGTEEIADILGTLFASDDSGEWLAHHAHFEGLILSHHLGIRPRTYRDTLSMGRAIFPKTERNDLGSLAARLGVANKLVMPDFKGKRAKDLTDAEKLAIGEYNIADVDSCYQAYHAMVTRIPSAELDLIDITVRMFANPVMVLDRPRAEEVLHNERVEKGALIEASQALTLAIEAGIPLPKVKKGEVLTDEKLLSSNKVFPKLLEYLGIPCPMKMSPATGQPAPALAQTDTNFTCLQHYTDTRVSSLVKGRLAAKSTIGETRALRLLKAGEGNLCLPVYLNYCGAHTTRWSGGDKLNFQNFPRNGLLRRTLMAPPGHVLVVVDSSQIEPRVLAWLAGEGWLLDAFASGADAYCIFGTKVYGRVITKADKEERQLAKVCVLALGYSMGAPKLQQTFSWGTLGPAVNLPIEICEGFVRMYRQSSQNVTALWETLNDALGDIAKGREGEYKCLSWGKDEVLLPNGMTLHYPECRATVQLQRFGGLAGRARERVVDASYLTPKGRNKLYGGLMTENMVQALARVIVAEQMRQIAKRVRVVMMSHDEVVMLVREDEAADVLAFGLAEMRRRPDWAPSIPLDAEGGYDVRYSK